MKTKRLIVTIGEHNVLLLRSIFQITQDTPELSIIGLSGRSAADSYARTQLLLNTADIALVVDAESNDPLLIKQNRQFLERSLGEIPTNRSYRIIVVATTLLSLLFRHGSLTEQFVGERLTDLDFAVADYEPEKILRKFLPDKGFTKALAERLRYTDVTSLADEPDLKELKKFVEQARKTARTAA